MDIWFLMGELFLCQMFHLDICFDSIQFQPIKELWTFEIPNPGFPQKGHI